VRGRERFGVLSEGGGGEEDDASGAYGTGQTLKERDLHSKPRRSDLRLRRDYTGQI
jgi:hypothetical protein